MNLRPLTLSCSKIPLMHDKVYDYLAIIPWQPKLIIENPSVTQRQAEQAWALPKKGGADESQVKLLPGNFFPRASSCVGVESASVKLL